MIPRSQGAKEPRMESHDYEHYRNLTLMFFFEKLLEKGGEKELVEEEKKRRR